MQFRDQILKTTVELHREGSVGKFVDGSEWIYFKEKNDTPKYEKVPRAEDPENARILLPALPESEVMGALEKAYADLGIDFFYIRPAMKLFAEYVSVEQKKHNCSKPERKLIDYYKERVEELRRQGL
jgi:hypothetical protein